MLPVVAGMVTGRNTTPNPMNASERCRPVPSPDPPAVDAGAPPLWPRLGTTTLLLAAAVGAHLWLVRAPAAPPATAASVGAEAALAAPALSVSPPVPRRSTPSPLVTDTSARSATNASQEPEPVAREAAPRSTRSAATVPDAAGDQARRQTTARPHTSTGTSGTVSAAPTSAAGTRRRLETAPPPRVVATLTRSEEIDDVSAGAGAAGRQAPARLLTVEPTEQIAASLSSMAGPWTAPSWSEAPRSAPLPAADRAVRDEVTGAPTDLDQQEALVLEVLKQYAQAYDRLDVQAVKAVWPTLDVPALQRAFRGLDSHRFRFTSCGVVSMTGEAANAHCRGDVTYRPKVGSGRGHLPPREWNFDLSRHEDGWHIVRMNVQ
jgi:hypothetical protein